ncbi:hypothetical protein [Arthrospira platensis]|jgi:hypothetical protein|uniref:Uncharacterized protein n=1 Tax=Limnospira platensis NIES-46 TaxID=1236695 RepID=A0A5M3T618_LIMPL|nr:hypothetical protein [Arthrospira platensis]KDR57550.1 hypothetical protein APPUASWS_010510 [Arthrospira platensis str. Paraca]MBD2711408.1 hypothetical protein [Arthrospira platensis FACHB-835]MDF2212719.1 hypothetical protein [Arthrospira platensis NCB002]MDT9183668.1 hypothetical protein [Limnospira sp. PMC 289.06]MDT9312705.1 hypothetical protein [Limnospira sp. Paracas R14]QQW31711.1 hypothetical protein AP9108_15410 [Arthrospira sp. PCC 9108]BAI91047.1 hypothetical protein NIES39_H0
MFDTPRRSLLKFHHSGLWVGYLLPVLSAIAFVGYFAVDVPSFDQWVLPGLFEKTANGNLTFPDLFALHNTHRIFFPRLIFIGLGFLSQWNIKAELYFSLGLAIISFLGLYKLSLSANGVTHIYLFHLANFLACILFFSLNQEWLWGFQIPIFLINFCIIFALLIFMPSPLNPRHKFLIAAGLCAIASFSSAQGLVSWLAVMPSLISLPGNATQQRKRSLIWLLLFLLSCGLYAIGYQREPLSITLSGWERVYTFIHFWLNVLAAPIVQSPQISWLLGLVIIIFFLYLLYYHSRKYSKFQTFLDASPWISLGIFSLLTSLLMTWGRVDLGANYPLTAVRYTSHTTLLLIAIVYLSIQWISEKYASFNLPIPTLIYSFICGILACLVWVSSGNAIARVQTNLFYSQTAQTCLYLFPYLDSQSTFFQNSPQRCLLPLSRSTWWIQEGVESLQNIGFRNFANQLKFTDSPDLNYGYIDFPLNPDSPQVIQSSESLTLRGWAILPDRDQQPQLVFLSKDDQQLFFASAYVNLYSPDLADILQSDRYQQSRWTTTLPPQSLPPGETQIKAWVYDPEQHQFFRLNGQIIVQITPL